MEAGGVCQKDEGEGLGDLFGEGIVEDECVVTTLSSRYIICPLQHGVGFAFSNPFDRLETDSGQLLDYAGLLVAGAGGPGRCGEVLV